MRHAPCRKSRVLPSGRCPCHQNRGMPVCGHRHRPLGQNPRLSTCGVSHCGGSAGLVLDGRRPLARSGRKLRCDAGRDHHRGQAAFRISRAATRRRPRWLHGRARLDPCARTRGAPSFWPTRGPDHLPVAGTRPIRGANLGVERLSGAGSLPARTWFRALRALKTGPEGRGVQAHRDARRRGSYCKPGDPPAASGHRTALVVCWSRWV